MVAQILGTLLKVNYTIDPAVHGTATLHTVRPLNRTQLVPTLELLLAQNGAALVTNGGLYRVVPAAQAIDVAASGPGTAGAVVVPLHYASAEALLKVLQPYVGEGGKIAADPGRNALLIAGEPGAREGLIGLVKAFDTDVLADQSYAVLPVTSGDVKDFASALQDAFRGQNGGRLGRIGPGASLSRINAVLVVSTQQRYIDEARRVYALIDRARRQTSRNWHVYYLQNSHSEDVAYVLQQAFTPRQRDSPANRQCAGATDGPILRHRLHGQRWRCAEAWAADQPVTSGRSSLSGWHRLCSSGADSQQPGTPTQPPGQAPQQPAAVVRTRCWADWNKAGPIREPTRYGSYRMTRTTRSWSMERNVSWPRWRRCCARSTSFHCKSGSMRSSPK